MTAPIIPTRIENINNLQTELLNANDFYKICILSDKDSTKVPSKFSRSL